jgi:hypothetical protein
MDALARSEIFALSVLQEGSDAFTSFDTEVSNEYRCQNGPLFTDAQTLSVLLI